jgi:hypothetical protein
MSSERQELFNELNTHFAKAVPGTQLLSGLEMLNKIGFSTPVVAEAMERIKRREMYYPATAMLVSDCREVSKIHREEGRRASDATARRERVLKTPEQIEWELTEFRRLRALEPNLKRNRRQA